MEQLPEPTADGEPEPATIREPAQETANEQSIAPQPEPLNLSNQVREPATSPFPKGVLVEIEYFEGSPAHTPATEGELQMASGIY